MQVLQWPSGASHHVRYQTCIKIENRKDYTNKDFHYFVWNDLQFEKSTSNSTATSKKYIHKNLLKASKKLLTKNFEL